MEVTSSSHFLQPEDRRRQRVTSSACPSVSAQSGFLISFSNFIGITAGEGGDDVRDCPKHSPTPNTYLMMF